VSTSADPDWVELLHTAKTIRRSVRRVTPSAGFRDHLSSDLASALGAPGSAPAVQIKASQQTLPATIVGACLGLFAAALALILLRGSQTTSK
jgi:hypothetical protein